MPTPRHLSVQDIPRWLQTAGRTWRQVPGFSLLYAAPLAVLALFMFLLAWGLQAWPMIYALASGFLLVGGVASAGLILQAMAIERHAAQGVGQIARRLLAEPRLLVLFGLSLFIWLIWITDAGILYGLYFSQQRLTEMPTFGLDSPLQAFLLFSGLMGAVPVLIMFAVATFAVPLLLESRCSLPQAIVLSVRTVFGNPLTLAAWGALVTLLVLASLLVLPLFFLVFPLLGYASFACYRQAFP